MAPFTSIQLRALSPNFVGVKLEILGIFRLCLELRIQTKNSSLLSDQVEQASLSLRQEHQILVEQNALDDLLGHIILIHAQACPAQPLELDPTEQLCLDMKRTHKGRLNSIPRVGCLELRANRLGQADHCEFCRAVVGELIATHKATHTGHIANVTLIVLDHGGQELSDEPEVS